MDLGTKVACSVPTSITQFGERVTSFTQFRLINGWGTGWTQPQRERVQLRREQGSVRQRTRGYVWPQAQILASRRFTSTVFCLSEGCAFLLKVEWVECLGGFRWFGVPGLGKDRGGGLVRRGGASARVDREPYTLLMG